LKAGKFVPQSRSTAPQRYLAIAALYDRLKWTQYTRFGFEEDAMPESQSDIDYTVDIGRHETTFRANTPKGEEFLGGVDLTMSNEEAHTFIQDARAAGLTVKSVF
jgi:hypothetical protein